jgi:hypothetical protein
MNHNHESQSRVTMQIENINKYKQSRTMAVITIVKSFSPVSLPRTPSNPTIFPFISKMFTIAYAGHCVRQLPPVSAAYTACTGALGDGFSAQVRAHVFIFDRPDLPSLLTLYPQLASTFLVSATEYQLALVPSEMEEQSETEPVPIPSITRTSPLFALCTTACLRYILAHVTR